MNTRSLFRAGIVGFGLTVALSGGLVAEAKQGDPAGAPGAQRRMDGRRMMMDRMAATLNLTPQQKQKFEAHQNAMRARMRKMRDAQDKKILAILTPQQAAKFKQARQNRGGGGPMMRGRITDTLGLTPKQQQQIQAIRRANRDQMRSIRDADQKKLMAILTPAQAAKLKSMRASWGGPGPNGRRMPGGRGPGGNSVGAR